METKWQATVEELYHVPENGKAELVNGMLVRMSPTGCNPSRASGKSFASLLRHEEDHGGGYAFPDNTGFLVDLPHRKSFSPDAAWFFGYSVDSMKFLSGAPRFAVEVRSEHDYGRSAERRIKAKITDYFAAGTLVVWDVDLLDENVVRVFRADSATVPTVYRRGDIADAEPAVAGWRFAVDSLF